MSGGPVDDLRQLVTSVYAAEAEDYRDLWAPHLHDVALELVEALPAATHALDVGTGVGTLLPALRNRLGARCVVGVDLTERMIALADPSFGRVVGDAGCLPLAASSFDVVVAAFMLFHLPRPQDGVAEARRVLRRGGTLGVLTWESDSGSAALDAWNDELGRHGAPELPATAHHDPVDRPEKVAALLDADGFTDVRMWTTSRRDESTIEGFLERRLRMGTSRRRLALFDPEARSACVAAATERIRGLSPQDFISQWRFVLVTARA